MFERNCWEKRSKRRSLARSSCSSNSSSSRVPWRKGVELLPGLLGVRKDAPPDADDSCCRTSPERTGVCSGVELINTVRSTAYQTKQRRIQTVSLYRCWKKRIYLLILVAFAHGRPSTSFPSFPIHDVVRRQGHGGPYSICIYQPAKVTSSEIEPHRCWTSNSGEGYSTSPQCDKVAA